jgi:OOP family OmpA-OmpF porin
VEDLQDDLNELILDQVVEFEIDSFALTPKGTSLLDEVLDALASAPDDIRIEIAGHTDNAGSESENLLLSQRRAQAVLDYLVANGQDPERFEIIGYGESQPIASNDTEDGRARNRRIEFTALFEEAP